MKENLLRILIILVLIVFAGFLAFAELVPAQPTTPYEFKTIEKMDFNFDPDNSFC